MHSYLRSLVLTAALVLAATICLIVAAAPPQEPEKTGEPRPAGTKPGPDVTSPAGPAPISLADSDGQELILEDLSVRAAIHGMLSLTELEFRFRNPKPRRIEGRFACTLPAGATISRFAKEVSGQMMEGEVIERLRANQVYESYLHQMRDPALLEQDQGNRFSARIFPIEANDSVRILLSYTRLLPQRDGVRTYTLPLRGIPEVGHFTFRAFVTPLPGESASGSVAGLSRTSVDVLTREERNYTPDRDIELTWRALENAPRSRVLRAGDFYLATFASGGRAVAASTAPRSWAFYIDTSASSAEGAEHRIRALEAVVRALPAGDDIDLYAFDNGVVRISSIRDLRDRLFLGGTDLSAAIRHASKRPAAQTVVFVSDLAATLGAAAPSEVLAATRELGLRPVHALILGSRQDAQTARALTDGRGRVVEVPFSDTLELSATAAAASLRLPLGRTLTFEDGAAEWVYPNRIGDVQPGDEVIVLGRTRAGTEPAIRANGIASDAVVSALADSTFGPLLEREAYRAYLDYLSDREAAEPSEAIRRALAAEQVRISVEQRVVIPRTTMLVLENEWEYQRWGIDRRALAAILTIGAGGIERIDRKSNLPRPMPESRPHLKEERIVPQSAPPPPPVSAPLQPGARDRADSMDSNAAGAAGGKVSAVMEAITVAPSAPPVASRAPELEAGPSRMTVRQRAVEPKRVVIDWTHPDRITRDDAGELRKRLRDDPRDRALYNQLSDALVSLGDWRGLRSLAIEWQPFDPENPHVYEILGLAAEELGSKDEAARAYASLIEVAPAKTELLQRAGLLLVRVGKASLAETPLRRALELRPDRANGYRHLALMLWLDGRPAEAARVLESALGQSFPAWYGDVHRVIRDELAYVYRSWGSRESGARADIADRAAARNVNLDHRDALRITLAWETDANDVDLHVVDPLGQECFYSSPRTRSGLELYGDITQGLGPEVIRASATEQGTYHVGVRYFSSGPMGVSRGLVVILRAQRGGEPSVEVVPFRLMEGGGEIRYVAGVNVR